MANEAGYQGNDGKLHHAETLAVGAEEEHLWLKQSTFEQNQSLPLEFVDQLAKRNTKIVIHFTLLVLKQNWQALLKSVHDFEIGEVFLGEPSGRDDAQLSFDSAKMLGTVADDHDGLLDSAPRHFGRAMNERIGVQLPSARYTKEGCSGGGFGCGAAKGEVRVIFVGTMVGMREL